MKLPYAEFAAIFIRGDNTVANGGLVSAAVDSTTILSLVVSDSTICDNRAAIPGANASSILCYVSSDETVFDFRGGCILARYTATFFGRTSNNNAVDDFRAAEQIAGDQTKDLFIFYKWWLSQESNRMHSEVLTDQQVFQQLKNTVNLIMERDSTAGADQYMSKYGITSAPAFVVARPDGTFKTCTGFVPKERFVEFLKNAKTASSAQQ